MMGRLIDSDALQKYLREEYHGMISDESMKIYEILRLIDAQPTAYDTEKVVEEIEKLKNPYDADQWFSDKKLRKAQEIVRRGGAE